MDNLPKKLTEWQHLKIVSPDSGKKQQAYIRQAELTKPPGSLGKMEELAVRIAAMQNTLHPVLDKIWITIFAADHGIASEAVSAFPQSVTAAMVGNFACGGAAINVLAQQIGAHLEIVDVGVCRLPEHKNIITARVGNGTNNFLHAPAMSEMQLEAALHVGRNAVQRALTGGTQLYLGGEMGIANTTSAAAMASAVTGIAACDVTGTGSGIDQSTLEHKIAVIQQALFKHAPVLHNNPLTVLQCLGGFEIAALVGAYLTAAAQGLPVLIDGFICSVASLLAVKINRVAKDWFIYAHRSQEEGHQIVLQQLQVQPLLDLQMRLGEGSGAAAAVPVLRSACALHNEMATFAEANVGMKNT